MYWSKVRVRAPDCDNIINHQITDLQSFLWVLLVIWNMSLKVWSVDERLHITVTVGLSCCTWLYSGPKITCHQYICCNHSLSLSLKPLCSLNSLSTSLRQNDELYLLDRNCRQICRLKISKLWLSLLSFLRNLCFRHQLIRHWELFFLAAHKLKELGEIVGLVGGFCPWWRNDLKPLLANFAWLEVSSLLFVCLRRLKVPGSLQRNSYRLRLGSFWMFDWSN